MAALDLSPPAPRRHLRELDWLMLAVVGLCCLGLVMAVSISGPQDRIGPLGAMKAQGGKLLMGLMGFLICALVPLSTLRRWSVPLFVGAAGLCYLTRFLGRSALGAARWLEIGGHSFQPVELARFLLLIAVAHVLGQAGARAATLRRGLLPVMLLGLLLVGGLLLQPDHGNALLVLFLCVVLAVLAGTPLLWIGVAGGLGAAGFFWFALKHDYVLRRLTDFMAVEPGTQVGQSLVAIAGGETWGRGLGESWMKMGFVPEAENDFVFAVVAEELGYAGSLLVLALFTIIGVAGYRLAVRTQDPFRRFLVYGFTLLITVQAAINLMVVSGWAPAKGIDLPFVSSGGTSLLFCLSAIGIVGNAARSDRSDGGARFADNSGGV